MPLPREDSIFRWQYTLVTAELFDDSREPKPIVLAGEQWPIPHLDWANPPGPDDGGLGCWWFPQDLAATPIPNALATLSVAERIGAVAVLSRRIISAASEVRLLKEVNLCVPVGAGSSSIEASIAKRALVGLIGKDTASALNALAACKESIENVLDDAGDSNRLPLSICIVEFPQIDGPGGRPKLRAHPAVIFDTTATSAWTDNGEVGSP